MLRNSIDHTLEVKNKLSAIKTTPRDFCSFYQPREICLVPMKECWYCRYASFDFEGKGHEEQGSCNYLKKV